MCRWPPVNHAVRKKTLDLCIRLVLRVPGVTSRELLASTRGCCGPRATAPFQASSSPAALKEPSLLVTFFCNVSSCVPPGSRYLDTTVERLAVLHVHARARTWMGESPSAGGEPSRVQAAIPSMYNLHTENRDLTLCYSSGQPSRRYRPKSSASHAVVDGGIKSGGTHVPEHSLFARRL